MNPSTDDSSRAQQQSDQVTEPTTPGAEDDSAPTANRPTTASSDSAQQRRDERWRERARTAEERVARLQQREVEHLLRGHVSDPEAALILAGRGIDTLLDTEGDVDADAVAAMAQEVITRHPSLRPTATHHADLAAKRPIPAQQQTTWSGFLSKK